MLKSAAKEWNTRALQEKRAETQKLLTEGCSRVRANYERAVAATEKAIAARQETEVNEICIQIDPVSK